MICGTPPLVCAAQEGCSGSGAAQGMCCCLCKKFPWNFMGTKVQILKKPKQSSHLHLSCIQGKTQKFCCVLLQLMLAKLGAAESSQNRVGGAEVLSTTSAPCPAMPPQANNPLSGQTQAWRKQNQPWWDVCCKTTSLACFAKFQEVLLWCVRSTS